tara:strand:- start:776 stop:991 length:216 start_codon:yes stop_codon:yes gene_type:complete
MTIGYNIHNRHEQKKEQKEVREKQERERRKKEKIGRQKDSVRADIQLHKAEIQRLQQAIQSEKVLVHELVL